MTKPTTKIVKTRDAATAVLRKLKIGKDRYNDLIKKLDDGTYEVNLKPKKEKLTRITISSVARGLIEAGKSNVEVWKVIKEQFKLSDDKRHYPSWFRCQLKRSKKQKGGSGEQPKAE